RAPDTQQKQLLHSCLEEEFKTYDSIIIGLEHLYPECQTTPSFLKGGDRFLYDLLTENDDYDVQVVAATIYHIDDWENDHIVHCDLFTPTIVKRALGILPAEPPKPQKTKLVLASRVPDEGVLDYSPYVEYTGNDRQL